MDKHDDLVKTAKELFFKYGVKRVTVEEICREAGISKVTFYKYFQNKNQLARFIRDQLMEDGFAKFDEINAMDISYPEKIELTTAWRIAFTSSMTGEFVKDIMDMEYVRNQQEQIKRRYLSNIRQAQEKGEINPALSTEAIWLVTEKFNELAKETQKSSVFANSEDMQKQLRELYFYGLLARKDR